MWRRLVVGTSGLLVVLVSLAWAAPLGLTLRWTDVSTATEYRLHVRRPPTPWSTGTPMTTRTPIVATLTPGTRVPAWESAAIVDLPPGEYEIAVSACHSGGCSALSNTKGVSVWTPTSTPTATVTATNTRTATATTTPTLAPPILLDLDLTGDGRVTALDAARALQRGDWRLAWRCLMVAVGLADPRSMG